MKRILFGSLLVTSWAGALLSADQATAEKGKAEEARSCVACHGLKIVHDQRLSRTVWGRELDKMERWGAVIENREALLEYLTANFGDDKPAPALAFTGDGTKKEATDKKY
jgi:mono/diheme cytochrome c family protein